MAHVAPSRRLCFDDFSPAGQLDTDGADGLANVPLRARRERPRAPVHVQMIASLTDHGRLPAIA
jgi:hypothetical protein